MSQTLPLELSNEVYAAIQHQAETVGTSPAHLVAAALTQQFGFVSSSNEVGAQRTDRRETRSADPV
jgi:hypothetical protein